MSLYGPLSSRETRILWGIVPSALQEAILAELHEYATHEGLVARNERRHRDNCLVMCRMWSCAECQMVPAAAPLRPWNWPARR